jgi:Protein of unknown function (DUF4065)
MADLRDIILYLCQNYPYKHELSKARLTKMVYLADWRSAITRGTTLTDIQWRYNHYGPYVNDISDVALADPDLDITRTTNAFGGNKGIISARPGAKLGRLADEEKDVLDHVIRETGPLYWNDFVRMIYSTYPVLTRPQYETLDLLELAKEYDSIKEEMLDPLLDIT